MPKIDVIKAKDAPPQPKVVAKKTQEMIDALNALQKDEVLKIEPDEGKSIRGLKTGIGRIASGQGLKVSSWSDEDGFVYVRKA